MSKLRIRNGPYSGRERTLGSDPVSIGRDAEAGIQILDRSASRFHAEVFPVGGMFFVRDLESKNGTYVNDDRLGDEELIREGDVIKIGTTELVFESGAYHDDAEMLSNTLEFKIDDLTDLEDQADDRITNESRALQILYQIGKLVTDSRPSEMVAGMLDYLIQAMPCQSALIFLRERTSGRLQPLAVRTAAQYGNPTISRTIIRRTVAENRAFFTTNAQEDERFSRKDSTIQKGVASVICVPVPISGLPRGVLYLSRSVGDDPFTTSDMELLSACALQVGLALENHDRLRANRRTLWAALWAMVRAREIRSDNVGLGDRCARAASALAQALGLAPDATWQLQVAGLLHELRTVADDGTGQNGIDLLRGIEDFGAIVELVRCSAERLEGSGPEGQHEDELDTECRILAVAAAFAGELRRDPDTDAVRLIERMLEDPGYDEEVVRKLKALHLDGSLYQAVTVE